MAKATKKTELQTSEKEWTLSGLAFAPLWQFHFNAAYDTFVTDEDLVYRLAVS